MANMEESANSPEHSETLPPSAPPPPPPAPPVVADDVEQGQTPSASVTKTPEIRRSWRREDLYKNAALALRVMGLLFSFLALIIMATNKHDGSDFVDFEEYSYLLAVAVISTVYTGGQVYLQVHELATGVHTFSRKKWTLCSFIGDQIAAYLLISAGSAAVPITNSLRDLEDDYSSGGSLFTDSSSAAIAMAFIAFLFLAVSALVSGYKLSHQSYI